MPRIDGDQVDALARLARLALDTDERATLTHELGGIVGYLDAIARVDVTGVVPWSPPVFPGVASALRADEIGATLERDEILACVPASADGLVVVPRFVES